MGTMRTGRRTRRRVEIHFHLRDKAEKIIALSPDISQDLCIHDPDEIIHELKVHQIELEIQNEELKKAHRELEESRDQYLDLYDFAPVGYVTLTKEAIIAQINLTCASMLQKPRIQLINSRFRRFVSSDSIENWDCFFSLLCNHKGKLKTTLNLTPPDGTPIFCQIEGVKIDFPGDSGLIRLGIMDISDLKEAQTELKNSEERFRTLVQNIPSICVQGYTLDGTIRYWNDASTNLYGYSAEEAIGKNLLDLIIPYELEHEVRDSITRMAKTGSPTPASEFNLKKKDGSRVPVFSSHVVLQSNLYGQEFFRVDVDLRDLKRTEYALHEANQRVRLLSGLTRHDVINQIAIIKGVKELTINCSDIPSLQNFLSIADEAADRITTLIRFTLEYEEIGMHPSRWQSISSLIDSVILEAPIGNITLKNETIRDLEIYSDTIIQKVFSTLVDNALRHGKNTSNIRFFCLEKENKIYLICEDDGGGISSSEKELIFNKGFGKNTGIGLFMAQEILSIYDFSISETGVFGEGARFEIEIPEGKFRRKSQ